MIISWPQVPKNCIKFLIHHVFFENRDPAKRTLTPLNKRVEKGIVGDTVRYSQSLSSQNAISIIGGIGWRNVAFLVAVRRYKTICDALSRFCNARVSYFNNLPLI